MIRMPQIGGFYDRICATTSLWILYFLRKFRGEALKNTNDSGVDVLRDKVVIVNSFEECKAVAQNLLRKCEDYRILGFDCEWVTDGRRNPVALMQLASGDGFCALIRLCFVEQVPLDLKKILEDASIYKVGVVPNNDAAYLMQDYGLVVRGCLDLRHLMARSGMLSQCGLRGMAQHLLGVELDKSMKISCSNWEAPVLSSRQIQYASQDAQVAVDIFSKLVQHELKPWWNFWGPGDDPKWSQIVELCQRYVDVKYKKKRNRGKSVDATRQDGSGQLLQQASRPNNKPASRAYSTRQKPLYDNCVLQAPDGDILSTCDHRKAEWYLLKKLGEKVCDNPLTVRLLFEPSGRAVDEVGHYYTQEKANRCVVCGSSKSYIRKNIVPHEYRKHFPAVMKDHISHDVLLLCLSCHLKSNSYDVMLRQQLAVECNAPIGSYDDVKVLDVPELKSVRSAARALLSSNADRIPSRRKKELEHIVRQHFDAEDGAELTGKMLQEANDLVVSVMNANYEPHGLRVVRHFSNPANGGLMQFEKKWREQFLAAMCPLYLPALWSVQHNHQRLKQRIAQGRIRPEEVRFAGIKLDEC